MSKAAVSGRLRRGWLVGGFLLCLLLAACAREAPRLAPLASGSVVLAFGDSVTHGTGASTGQDYPSQLAALTGWVIINAGVPGDRAESALPRLQHALAEHKPAMVLLCLGGNDFLKRRSPAQVAEALRAMLRSIREAGAQPVLIAVPGLSAFGALTGSLSDEPLYRALADAEQVPLIERVFADTLSDPALRSDPIHPNAAGYAAMTEGIHRALRQVGLAP